MFDRRTISIIFTILIFVGVLALAYAARRPLLILIFSVLFAYLLEPLVAWFQGRFRGSRSLGIVATYLLLVVALSIVLGIAGSKIVQQTTKMAHELPDLIENIGSGNIAQQIGSQQGWTYDTRYVLQQFLRAHRASIVGTVQRIFDQAATIGSNLLWFLLIPVLSVFVLKSKTKFAAAVLVLANNRHDRQCLRGILTDLDVMLSAFIRAQLSLASISVVAYSLLLVPARFPYSFSIAAIAGILEFIPLLGPLAGNGTIMGVAIVTGYPHGLAILAFLIVWRGLQDYVTAPLLMGQNLKLHPFTVIFGVLVCGEVAGLPGIFLSVPLMATLRIVWKNWEKRGVAIEEENAVTTEAETIAV